MLLSLALAQQSESLPKARYLHRVTAVILRRNSLMPAQVSVIRPAKQRMLQVQNPITAIVTNFLLDQACIVARLRALSRESLMQIPMQSWTQPGMVTELLSASKHRKGVNLARSILLVAVLLQARNPPKYHRELIEDRLL